MIFCMNFVINFVSFSFLKEKNIYWNTINNTLFCKSNYLIVETLKKTAKQQMLKKIRFSNIFVTSQIHQKIFRASHLSFIENNAFWHAHIKHSKSMSLHKLNSICLDMTFWDSSITECKICSLVKIKHQISQQLLNWTLIKSCQKIHIN